jgi:hypothetical protein
MKFDELDERMRVFETAHDLCVLPGIWMVARLDGKRFTRLTKEVHQFEAPFDPKFRDMMLDTVEYLMNCGFKVIYGYKESDEISLLLSQNEDRYNRKLRKLISILAGEASAKFSLLLGDVACFDCRTALQTHISYWRSGRLNSPGLARQRDRNGDVGIPAGVGRGKPADREGRAGRLLLKSRRHQALQTAGLRRGRATCQGDQVRSRRIRGRGADGEVRQTGACGAGS